MAKRDYDNDYPSVTTVLGILRNFGLEHWFKINSYANILKESEEGKLIGTQLHDAFQQHIETNEIKLETEYPEQVKNALNGFMLFKKENPQLVLHKSEIKMTSVKYKYNGTLDCLGIENSSRLVLLDWKSGKAKKEEKPPIYDEYKYQVSAYVKAYNELNEKKVELAGILALAKDKVAYNYEEINMTEIEDMFKDVFLPCLSIYNFQRESSKKNKSNKKTKTEE